MTVGALCAAVVLAACGGSSPSGPRPSVLTLDIGNTPDSLNLSSMAGETIPQSGNCHFGPAVPVNGGGSNGYIGIVCNHGLSLSGFIFTRDAAVSQPSVVCSRSHGYADCVLRKGAVLINIQARQESDTLALVMHTTAYLYNLHPATTSGGVGTTATVGTTRMSKSGFGALCAALVLAAMAGLAGCGGGQSTTSLSAPAQPASPQPAPTTTATSPPSPPAPPLPEVGTITTSGNNTTFTQLYDAGPVLYGQPQAPPTDVLSACNVNGQTDLATDGWASRLHHAELHTGDRPGHIPARELVEGRRGRVL
jgi:hypothetical protein